ncbi:MAG: hypothetical protein HDR27_09420 [Lachnospiraceae bacterium]|nr:hypothetical protein [Lachnospiraceae bacterium]
MSEFHDAEIAAKYNAVLDVFLKSSNNFEQVNSQTVAIGGMRGSSQELEDSIQNIQNAVQNIQGNAHEVIETSQNSLTDMRESVKIVGESVKWRYDGTVKYYQQRH